jgi:hypothetical protein
VSDAISAKSTCGFTCGKGHTFTIRVPNATPHQQASNVFFTYARCRSAHRACRQCFWLKPPCRCNISDKTQMRIVACSGITQWRSSLQDSAIRLSLHGTRGLGMLPRADRGWQLDTLPSKPQLSTRYDVYICVCVYGCICVSVERETYLARTCLKHRLIHGQGAATLHCCA